MGPRLRVVHPSPWAWVEALGLALYNWVADLLTLIFCVWTIHADVPWRGIVIAYALTQISASIPITPGGLAVVEASLTALLTAYGMPATSAVTVVLLYRIISFWILVPIGWAAWGYLEVAQRRALQPGSRARRAHKPARRHPWAFHRHGGEDLPASRARGPERVMPPAPCEGCDEPEGAPQDEPVTASRPER
jgi:hypothetical protein